MVIVNISMLTVVHGVSGRLKISADTVLVDRFFWNFLTLFFFILLSKSLDIKIILYGNNPFVVEYLIPTKTENHGFLLSFSLITLNWIDIFEWNFVWMLSKKWAIDWVKKNIQVGHHFQNFYQKVYFFLSA